MLGKRGNGTPTKWLELDGKTGVLTSWNKQEQREEEFGFVAGKLTGVAVKERDYGVKGKGFIIELTLKDPSGREQYKLQTGASSRVTTRLLGQLNAAPLDQPVYIAPYLMKEGDVLQDNSEVRQDTVMTSVKTVLGINEDSLDLSEGIRPFYGEGYAHGDRLPAPKPILKGDGTPLVQNGQPLMDRTELEELCAGLVTELQAKLGRGQAQRQSEGDGDGVDADAAMAAAGQADRSAMRARA